MDAPIAFRLHSEHFWRRATAHRRSICMRGLLFSLIFGITAAAALGADGSKSIYTAKARSALQLLATNQPNVSFLSSITNLPTSVSNHLAKVTGIADAGQPYSDGCIGTKPRRRFLLATKNGQTYNVAFEQGGFVITFYVWQFVVDETGGLISDQEIEPGASPFGGL